MIEDNLGGFYCRSAPVCPLTAEHANFRLKEVGLRAESILACSPAKPEAKRPVIGLRYGCGRLAADAAVSVSVRHHHLCDVTAAPHWDVLSALTCGAHMLELRRDVLQDQRVNVGRPS